MNPLDLSYLKDLLAAEWGVPPAAITVQQAKSRHRKRWAVFFVGLFALMGVYSLLHYIYAPKPARVLIGFVIVASLALNAIRLRWPDTLSPGRLAITRRELAKVLQTRVEAVDERTALEYVRREQRSILVGLTCLALTVAVAERLWPSTLLDLIVILFFYGAGMLAIAGLRSIRK